VCLCTKVSSLSTHTPYRAVHGCRRKVNFVLCVHRVQTAVLVVTKFCICWCLIGGWRRGQGKKVPGRDRITGALREYSAGTITRLFPRTEAPVPNSGRMSSVATRLSMSGKM
jgi:hypothetical protein